MFKAVAASDLPTRNKYEPPKINIVGGSLLEDNFEHVKGNNDTQLQKYSFTYGMAEMGYGEKLVKMMMFNILASTYGTTTVVTDILWGEVRNMLSIL